MWNDPRAGRELIGRRRDHFTAVALQGLLASPHTTAEIPPEKVAKFAVEIADLTLKELDK
jgi:hypothetical protein